MIKFPVILCVIFSLCGWVKAQIEEDDSGQSIKSLQTIFTEANTLMIQKDYKGALKKYYQGMDLFPEAKGLLYNGGLAAFQSGDYPEALNFWRKLKSVDNEDWQVRAKLIQTYQVLKKFKERDDERQALYDLRQHGNVAGLKLTQSYVREQTEFGGRKVMALEYFELKGVNPLRYSFLILDENEKPESTISLGFNEEMDRLGQEQDREQRRQSSFHLDGYFNGNHEIYETYSAEPSYDKIRLRVKKILEQKNSR